MNKATWIYHKGEHGVLTCSNCGAKVKLQQDMHICPECHVETDDHVQMPEREDSGFKDYDELCEEYKDRAHVFYIGDFARDISNKCITDYDGVGYFHDGYKKSDIDVFSTNISFYEAAERYPYVIWYNR